MNRIELQRELTKLVGCKVLHKRLVGGMIILYFGELPDDQDDITITIETAWRYSKGKQIILGNGDIPWEKDDSETEESFTERFNEICNRCTPLVSSELQKLNFDEISNDLCMVFSQGQTLKSFSCYTDDSCWFYRNCKKNIGIYVSVNTIKTRKLKSKLTKDTKKR